MNLFFLSLRGDIFFLRNFLVSRAMMRVEHKKLFCACIVCCYYLLGSAGRPGAKSIRYVNVTFKCFTGYPGI